MNLKRMRAGTKGLKAALAGILALTPMAETYAASGTPEAAKSKAGMTFGEFNTGRRIANDAAAVSALENAAQMERALGEQRGLVVKDVPSPALPPQKTGASWGGRVKEFLAEAAGLAGYLSGIPMEIGVQAGATLAAGAAGRRIIAMAGVRGPLATFGIIGGWPGGVLAGIATALKAAPLLGAAVWAGAGFIGGAIAGYSTVKHIMGFGR